MIRTTRALLAAAGIAAALALTGCGGADSEPSAGAEEDSATPATRTVTHARGTTEVPAEPARVVVLDTGELDSALAVGVTPVGAVTTDVSGGLLGYLAEEAGEVETVGTIGEPNLEAVAAADPDLILSNEVRHSELYDELSAIAPTVFAESVGAAWQDNFRLYAEALGRTTEAEAVLDRYESAAAALGESLGDPADTTVSALRFVEGTVRVYSDESFLGTVLTDVGVGRPDVVVAGVPAFAELGPERILDADADVLLYSSYGDPQGSGQAAVAAGPLWPRLSAVAAGRAFAVDDDYFYTGIGPLAAQRILADLEGLLRAG